MHVKRSPWVLCAWVVACVGTVLAADMPTPEFQNIMKSNAAIVDLVGGNGGGLGRDTNIEVRDVKAEPALRTHLRMGDFDAIAKDAATLKENFSRVEAFWVSRKADDAVALVKAATQQVDAIAAAAQVKDVTAITKAQAALANTCRDCHLAHRVVMLTDRTFAIR